MEIDLLVLNAEAEFKDIWEVYTSLLKHKKQQARSREIWQPPFTVDKEGIVIVTNDEVIEKHEFDLAMKGMNFFINWKVNMDYRNLIRAVIENGKTYAMYHSDGKGWHFKEASKNDIKIHDLEGMVDITPKYNQTLTV